MIDTQIHVAIASYKRAGKVTSLKVLPFAWIWVPESQGDDYRKYYGDRVITIPDALDGNLPRKRNAILDKAPCPWVMILDDDLTKIGYFEDGTEHVYTPETLAAMIEAHFLLADEFGCKLWGVNQTYDPLHYRTFTPFSLLSPILGPIGCHLAPELRYDEQSGLKEDYDFWLQNILKYHKVLRVNKVHYYHDHGSLPGGVVSQRTMAYEESSVAYMRQKWGSLFASRSEAGNRRGGDILNSLVKVPISGV